MDKLEVDLVCPGHGKMARKDLLALEKRYFTELRDAVKKGIDGKKTRGGDHEGAGLRRGTRSGPAWAWWKRT